VWCYEFESGANPRVIADNGSVVSLEMGSGIRLTFDGQWLSCEGQP
jgi:hypothetical protein